MGATSVLFDVPFDIDPFNNDATNYDVSNDGQRFIMIQRTTEPGGSRQRLNIVVNWTEALTRLARERWAAGRRGARLQRARPPRWAQAPARMRPRAYRCRRMIALPRPVT